MARPMSVVAEVVGTGSDGTEPSLLLSVRRHGVYSDDVAVVARLLFNCGEGTQRLCGENGVKLRSLDTVFFTRFDAQSVSGVPGVVFALGGLGAPRLRLHGPEGLAGFLGAIRSFVRRKFPQIECVHVTDRVGNAIHAHESSDGVVQGESWASGEQLVEDHTRIVAVVLQSSTLADHDADGAGNEHADCPFCVGEGTKLPQGRPGTQEKAAIVVQTHNNTRPGFDKHRGGKGDDEHAEMREWLNQFYSAKESSKLPYVDVVLNRYRGRYDELKAQLVAKYGGIEHEADKGAIASGTAALAPENGDASSSSSSDSDGNDSDSDTDRSEDERPAGKSTVLDRRWLLQFYREHQPDKVPHVDKVLKQFQGREETLKQMLIQKYGASEAVHVEAHQAPATSVSESVSSLEPQKKKLKSTEAAEASNEPCSASPAPTVFVADDSETSAETSDVSSDQPVPVSVCYVVWFHQLPPPHPVVWIIDCQSKKQLPSLVNRFSLGTDACSHKPSLVVHFTPPSVRRDPRYIKWMASVSSGAPRDGDSSPEHLVFDGEILQTVENGVFSFSFLASAKAAVRRREADESDAVNPGGATSGSLRARTQSVPLRLALDCVAEFLESTKTLAPHHRQRQIVLKHGTSQLTAHIAQSKLAFAVVKHRTERRGFHYERTGWASFARDEDEEASDPSETRGGVDPATPSAPASTSQQQLVESLERGDSLRKLIILGTGSAAPSKLRANSSIYVEIGDAAIEHPQSAPSLLLDCGEGTYGQLWRQFGASTPARIGGLRCIWISHHHADHQCGLVRILHEYCRHRRNEDSSANVPGLVVVAPQSVLTYVAHWLPFLTAQHGPAARLITTVACRDFNEHADPVRRKLLHELGFTISSLHSVPVRHCYDAYGLVVTSRDGRKFVYSGDTQPCDRLVRAGMGATLLIHEATFDDTMEQDASAKRHSTVSQALDVARRMKAGHVILTHFSQRYPSLPPTGSAASADGLDSERASARGPRADCAFDGFVHALPIW